MGDGLELEGVSKSFGNQEVLRDVTLSLGAGETGVIVGSSGVGKTTLLNVIAGTLRADAGRVWIGGDLVESNGGRDGAVHLRPSERNVGYVFQDYLLFPHLTVFENVAYGLRARHASDQVVRDEVMGILDAVGLREVRDKKPGQVSGGQMQRTALGRAIALKPRLLLLDEPLSALDRQTRETLRLELKRIFAQLATTAVYVTHDLDEGFFFGQKIGILRPGKLSSLVTRDDLLRNMNCSTAEFLGFNLLKVRYLRSEGSLCVFQATEWDQMFHVEVANAPQLSEGQDALLAFPPDSVGISRPGMGSAPGIRTEVSDVQEFKDKARVTFGDSQHMIVGEMPALEFRRLAVGRGDTVTVVIGSAWIVSDST